MAEELQNPIEVGKLYQLTKDHQFVNAPSADFSDMKDWDFDLVKVPKGSIVMPVKAFLSTSKRHPYLKVFCLWNEQIVYTGDYLNFVVNLLKTANPTSC